MPRVTMNVTTRVVVVRRCRSTGAGRRVSLGVARMPALVARRFALADKPIHCRMHRKLLMWMGFTAVVCVHAVRLCERRGVMVGAAKV